MGTRRSRWTTTSRVVGGGSLSACSIKRLARVISQVSVTTVLGIEPVITGPIPSVSGRREELLAAMPAARAPHEERDHRDQQPRDVQTARGQPPEGVRHGVPEAGD